MHTSTKRKQIPVLMYHSISCDAAPKFKQWAVSPALFADHMAYLHQQAYTPITISQFVEALSPEGPALPERPVILTFDDGFADFFTNALPILKQHCFGATLYIPTAFVNSTSRWLEREGEMARPMLSWQQLTEICACGIECGAHSHSHPQLDAIPWQLARNEVVLSKKLLEDHLGREVSSFAYPFGYHSATVRRLVRDAGYTSACTVKHVKSSEATDPFALARFTVSAWTNLYSLSKLLNPSFVSTMRTLVSTAIWQLARTSSVSLTRSLQKGYDSYTKGLVKTTQ